MNEQHKINKLINRLKRLRKKKDGLTDKQAKRLDELVRMNLK